MITAEEFLKNISPRDDFGLRINLGNSKKHIYEIMCRFAKLHVEAALNNIKKETQLWDDCLIVPYEKIFYSLENIK